jgi:protein-S-isoprenylcysteine O-methyltransferase Ste14
MHILGQTGLGVAILLLLAALVAVKRAATGTIMQERPSGGFWLWFIHLFNMFFLLVANPLAGVLLVTHYLDAADVTRVTVNNHALLLVLEIGGLALYVLGFALMAWALISLGRVYQVGGSTPRAADRIITAGPYALVRHPMYLAALCISLGLACMIQSLAYFAVFIIYLALILSLIPHEEKNLRDAYGDAYSAYQKRVGALIPYMRRSNLL